MAAADFIRKALLSGRRVAPSQPDPWHGTPAPGSRWTYQQIAKLKAEGRDPDTVRSCTVGVETQNDWAMPPQRKPILCPMLTKTKSGARALIITPAGDKIWKDIL